MSWLTRGCEKNENKQLLVLHDRDFFFWAGGVTVIFLQIRNMERLGAMWTSVFG